MSKSELEKFKLGYETDQDFVISVKKKKAKKRVQTNYI